MDKDNKQFTGEEIAEFSQKKRGSFTGKIGFVLAAAGSAVGLGNLWRFPYLAARYGGGIFILCYVLLAIFFGLTLLMLEIAIGRHTGKSVIGAFTSLNKKFKWFGFACIVVPMIIVPYYCVIGGWVIKYGFSFLVGTEGLVGSSATDTSAFFTNFITSPFEPLIFFLIFALITVFVVAFGVQKGIEKMSKILMPALAIMAVFLMIYVMCQDGALEGWAYVFIPNFSDFGFETILGALGQLFYSLSIGMCIMITYGSYMKKSVKITSSSAQIAIFDSAFALIATLIIIPAVFAFGNPEVAFAPDGDGPALMFIQLTNVFNALPGGRIIAIIFFILVLFAAITSSVSLVESIVAVLCEDGKMKRINACLIVFGVIFVLGTLSSLGFGTLSFISINKAGETMTILDMFDFLANNILMPIVAIITCVIAGWFIDKKILPKEIGIDNKKGLNTYFNVIIKYVAPICILLILITGLFISI